MYVGRSHIQNIHQVKLEEVNIIETIISIRIPRLSRKMMTFNVTIIFNSSVESRKRSWRCNIRSSGVIRNVYNIIESISPIHFWHHYLYVRLTITCERVRRSRPASTKASLFVQSRASSLTVKSCSLTAHAPLYHKGYNSGNSLLAGFRASRAANVMRLAFGHGMRACCRRRMYVLHRRSEICDGDNQWSLGLQCWIVG